MQTAIIFVRSEKMKIIQSGNPEIVMENRDSMHHYFGWPSVARLKNGTVVVGASGNRLAHVCPFGKAMLSYSYDDGNSFTPPAPVIDTFLDDRDTGLCPFGASGLVVTSFALSKSHIEDYLNKPGYMQYGCMDHYEYAASYLKLITEESNNKYKGATFRISTDNGVTFGELYRSPVSSPHGPCELSDGTILWVGTQFNGDNESRRPKAILAFRIRPDGTSKQIGAIPLIPNGEECLCCEPHAIQIPDGTVICHIRVEGGMNGKKVFSVYQSESADGGRSWTVPHPILPDKGGAPAHLTVHSSGMLISTYGYREAPYGIRAMFSEDGGKTWDTGHDVYVNNVSGDIGYPATVELTDGSLLTVFYAHKDADSPAEIFKVRWRLEK